MTSRLPHDPFLPELPASMDESAMTAVIAAHLPDCRAGEFSILACRPHYVRYKPETSCLVQYALTLRDKAGERHELSAHISMFADDRGRRRWSNGKMKRLIERASHHHGELLDQRAVYLADFRGLLHIYPVDYDLRGLVRASDPGYMTKKMRELLPSGRETVVPDPPHLLRYKPERKALLRFTLQNGPVQTLYAKLHTNDRSAVLLHATRSLIDAGVVTPRPMIHVPKLQLIAHEESTGIQLASLRGGPDFVSWMEPLSAALRHFQSTDLSDLPEYRLADEAATITRNTGWIGRIVPDLVPRLTRLSDRITRRLADLPERMATVHGDFYDDQALVSPSGVVLIDLDEVRRGHPLLDVGNILAHLTSGDARGDDTSDAREAFLASSLQDPANAASDIALFEAAALLKLAPGPFRRLEQDWPEEIERIVELAEMRLAQRRHTVSQPLGAVGNELASDVVTDPALPQLGALQRPGRMSEELSHTPMSGTVSVKTIELVRHKLGRRALFRYEITSNCATNLGREHVYAKTFASERGPRVESITRRITDARAFGSDVLLPEPVAFLPHLKLLVQRAVPGVPVESALRAGDRDLAFRIATALHHFHASGLDLGREHDLRKELSPLPDRASVIGTEAPQLGDLTSHCLLQVSYVGARAWRWRRRPIHRDFYHDQVLIDDRTLAILDLDDASMSEPAVDIANFAAHLRLLTAQDSDHADALADVERTFVESSLELDSELNPALVRFLTATTLVRLAGIHVTRANGVQVAKKLLEASYRILDGLHERAAPAGWASGCHLIDQVS